MYIHNDSIFSDFFHFHNRQNTNSTHSQTNTHTHIHIYTERERNRQKNHDWKLLFSTFSTTIKKWKFSKKFIILKTPRLHSCPLSVPNLLLNPRCYRYFFFTCQNYIYYIHPLSNRNRVLTGPMATLGDRPFWHI